MRHGTALIVGLAVGTVLVVATANAVSKPDVPEPAPRALRLKPIGAIEGENPAFDETRQPARVVAALGLKPGERVADVGAGLGYLTFRIAEAVGPSGRVVATDVEDEALDNLRARGLPNVLVRKVSPDDPGLEAGSFDLIVMSEVDHFLKDRVSYLKKLETALSPTGRIAVTHVRTLRAPLLAAAQQAGFRVDREYEGLVDHYLVVLVPAARSAF
jgi:precorrin-6B methylase 2